MANRLTTKDAQEFLDDLRDSFSKRSGMKVPRTLVKMKTVYETWAGMCYPGMIHVNRGIMKDVDEPFVKEILAHEFAHHIVDRCHYPDTDDFPFHGKVWKSVARAVGAFPSAYHFYPVAPFIMNNMHRFWAYEHEGAYRFLGVEDREKKGCRFWSNGKLWQEVDNKNKAVDFLYSFEIEQTKIEIERRLNMISYNKTFWRDYVK